MIFTLAKMVWLEIETVVDTAIEHMAVNED